jgi:hypothetical protein
MATEDPVQQERSPSRSELRWFGAVVFGAFALLGAVLAWRFEAPGAARILVGVGLGFALLYQAVPPLRIPLWMAWMTLFAPVGWLVSHALLAVIYFGLVTPLGLVMRLLRRDRLGLRPRRGTTSFWSEHDPASDVGRYFRQT